MGQNYRDRHGDRSTSTSLRTFSEDGHYLLLLYAADLLAPTS